MMKLVLFFTSVSLMLFGMASAASDTTNAPTPAEVITAPVTPDADLVAVLENDAIT